MENLLGNAKWRDFIAEQYADIRQPFSAGIELLPECNFRCIHCYAESDRQNNHVGMSIEELKSIIDTLVEHNCIDLFFTGGEVLLHRDFEAIYRYAKEKGVFVSVLTNGSLIDQRHIDLWLEYPPELVSITMYGASEETYYKVTQKKGGYEKVLHGIQLLKENGIAFELKCIGIKQCLQDIPAIRQFSCQMTGQPGRLAWDIRPRNDGSLQPIDCRVSPQQAFEVEMNDPYRRKYWDDLAHDVNRGKPMLKQMSGCLYPCDIAKQFVFITYDGYMQGCVKAVAPRYNLREGNFDEGWDKLGEWFVNAKGSSNYQCLKCDKFRYCAQCTAANCSENGDPEKPVSFFCQFGELLKRYMDEKVLNL